jgi:hypothetical protein
MISGKVEHCLKDASINYSPWLCLRITVAFGASAARSQLGIVRCQGLST